MSMRTNTQFTTSRSRRTLNESPGDHEMTEYKKLNLAPHPEEGVLPQALPGDRAKHLHELTRRAIERPSLFQSQQLTDKPTYNLKILLLGDPNGKKLFTSTFPLPTAPSCINTIGVDFFIQPKNDAQKDVNVQIWNISSSLRFSGVRQGLYYKSANGFVVVYDISDRVSFTNAVEHMKFLKEKDIDNVLLVGIHKEDAGTRAVVLEEATQIARSHKIVFSECDSRDTRKIKAIFDAFIDESISTIAGD